LPATKFLFWNLNRKPLAGLIADLAEEHLIDLIILAECEIDPPTMLRTLNRTSSRFHLTTGLCTHITIYSGFPSRYIQATYESERVSIRTLELPAREPVLLAAVHLPSKLHWTGESQAFECTELARQIDLEEQKAAHRRTVLVGDFNVNPFEAGMAGGLHSVMSRQVAFRGARTVQGREYPFFYNPMWSHFGDASSHTAGSYYYDAGEHVNHYWNMFDQVLLRPELASRFDSAQLSILKAVGALSLVRPDGRPDQQVGSDHLPLLFEVEF
jgi:endonuclease/exonuclease/phosphatase family metal-dependent hydrolase